MAKKTDKNFFFLGLLSFFVCIFYLFYVNFSIDTIILFLSNKIFMGSWLARGIFPWFNPHIYLGTPVAFDVGIGSFHPFNLFFLLPNPISFALWMGATSLMFLTGFYSLFKKHTKTNNFALFLTLVLFFSGSGIFRASNPTIFLVIAHYGYFILSLYLPKNKSIKSYILPLLAGVLMTISGHVQFVFYGYLLGLIYFLLFQKESLKKIALYFISLFILTLPYFILSLPLIFDSTRLTTSKDYLTTGNNSLLQYIQLFLPYIFGYVKNGSKWGPGSLYTILISLIASFMLFFAILRQNLLVKALFVSVIAASLGLINLPFFRGAGQVTILLHILGLMYIGSEERYLLKEVVFNKLTKKTFIVAGIVSIIIALFSSLPLFSELFIKGYKFVKHGQESLFFDRATVHSIGSLIALSFGHFFIFSSVIVILNIRKKFDWIAIMYVIVEGIAFVNFHSYFIPTRILTAKTSLPITRNSDLYRVQTAADLIPYFGISNYMGDLIFRPPFSKEVALFDKKEEMSFRYLNNLMTFIPSTWIMTTPYNAVQGFNTFMLSSLSAEFKNPSDDFKTEYKYIIDRNSLFADNEQSTSINSISSGHLTLNDPRWEKLGVRYFISDRPLKKYKLIENKNGRYVYEDEYTLPIYRITDGETITTAIPTYNDPNQWKFAISADDVGKEFQMVMNPGGLVAMLNGKEVNARKDKFLLRIPLASRGELTIYYSPVRHLQETLGRLRTN